MSLNFEKYAMKGNEFLNTLASNLGEENDKRRAARVLRSVLHVLRDHLTVEESIQLMAQLPPAIKNIYVNEWKGTRSDHKIERFDDFAMAVVKEDGGFAWDDFQDNDDVEKSIQAVVKTLANYCSPEEMEQAFGALPNDLHAKFNNWVHKWPAEVVVEDSYTQAPTATRTKFEFFY